VFEQHGALAADPLLAKSGVAQRVPERCTALIDDLLAVSDEQKATAGQFLPETRVVHRRHHSLSSPGRCDQQVAMVALVAGEVDVLQ
jgi:hypothetical protein